MSYRKVNMKDNSEQPELFDKMMTMSKAELEGYLSTVKFAKHLCNFAGISAVLLALFFPNIYMVMLSMAVLWAFSNLAVGADKTRDFALALMEKKYKDK